MWDGLHSRLCPRWGSGSRVVMRTPWAPGGPVLEARADPRPPSPAALVSVHSASRPDSAGQGGAWHPVPAPVSPSCFCSSTPGQDSGKVVIWNMSPVLQEDDEKDENVPKMLCQMDNHLGITGWPFAGFACWHSAQG